MRFLLWGLALVWQLLLCPAMAGEPVVDASQVGTGPASLTAHFAVLEDPAGAMTLTDVQQPEAAVRFKTGIAPASALTIGFTRSAYWLRLSLDNPTAQPLQRMFEIGYPLLSSVQFHQPGADGSYRSIHTGALEPFSSRAYAHRYFVFPLTLPAQSRQVVYVRLQSTDSIVVPARLWEVAAFHADERADYGRQAWFFGMGAAMVLFNLLLFVVLRDGIYLLYVIFASSMSLGLAGSNGLPKEFLWPQASQWADVAHFVCYSISLAVLLLFMRRMLDTRAIVPKTDVFIRGVAGALLLTPIGFVLAPRYFGEPTVLLYVAAILTTLCVGLYCAMVKRQRSAIFFATAFSMFCFGAAALALRGLGWLPSNALTINAVQVGSALEMILLAIALADRFNELRKEKDRAQGLALQAQHEALRAEQQVIEALRSSEKLLEGRVSDRTAELRATIERLQQTQADLVQADKLASLGTLVAGVAHELNTPIGNALVTASAMEDAARELEATMAAGEMRKSTLNVYLTDAVGMAELIGRSCRRAADLIHSFKQVAVDQTSEQRRHFDLSELVEDNVAALRPSFRDLPWVIHVNIPVGIACDSYPGPLGQVIYNIVHNAMDHAFKGHTAGTLTVSAHMQADAVEMTFVDDGNGMESAVLGRIFEPFYSTRFGRGGSGLGLSIAWNLVTGVLGGSLQASSEPGKGTRFMLRLPLRAPAHTPL